VRQRRSTCLFSLHPRNALRRRLSVKYIDAAKKRRGLPSEVLRLESTSRRDAPDLQEMHLLATVTFFRVGNTRSSRGKLYIAAFENLGVAHRVAAILTQVFESSTTVKLAHSLLELASNNVRKNFEFAMAVRSKAGSRGNTILVDNAQGAELAVAAALVPGQRTVRLDDLWASYEHPHGKIKGVEGLQPTMIGVSSFMAAARDEGNGGGHTGTR
jgi:hypothetical protein